MDTKIIGELEETYSMDRYRHIIAVSFADVLAQRKLVAKAESGRAIFFSSS